jgi:hypothetical protein
VCKECKSSRWISTRKNGFSYCDKCGHYYEEIGRVEIGTFICNPKNSLFLFIGESKSRLRVKVLADGKIDEKITRTS